MTTESVFGVAGPFTNVAGNRLENTTEFNLVDKVTGENIVIPAGNIVTEVVIRRKADEGDVLMDLTPGRGIAVGFNGDARALLETPGAITDELNNYDVNNEPYTYVSKIDPSTNFMKTQRSSHIDRNIVLQSAFGGNVTQGGVTVIIKYKPFSESIAKRHG